MNGTTPLSDARVFQILLVLSLAVMAFWAVAVWVEARRQRARERRRP